MGTIGAALLARQAEHIAELKAELRAAQQKIGRQKAELRQFGTLEGE